MEEPHQPVGHGEITVKLDGSLDHGETAVEGRLEKHGRIQTALYGNRRPRRRMMNRLTDGLLSFVVG